MTGARLLVLAITSALVVCGCRTLEPIDDVATEARTLRPPTVLARPMMERLKAFGRLVTAYAAGLDQEFVVEIDHMPNNSGIQKELPTDLGVYIEAALNAIGEPFRTTRRLPAAAYLTSGGVNSFVEERSNVAPTWRISGELMRVSELAVKFRDGRVDVAGSINTNPVDGQLFGDDRQTLTIVKLAVTLRNAAGVAYPGGTTIYEVVVFKDEQKFGVSIYVSGTGIGVGSGMVAAQDVGDALLDASAACVIHLIGTALLIPYYRVDTALFAGGDEGLLHLFERDVSRQAQAEVESLLKRLLFSSGKPMCMESAPLTDGDWAIVTDEMRRHRLCIHDPESTRQLAICLWKTLDYVAAADRIDSHISRMVRDAREAALRDAAAASQVSSAVDAVPTPREPTSMPGATVMMAFSGVALFLAGGVCLVRRAVA